MEYEEHPTKASSLEISINIVFNRQSENDEIQIVNLVNLTEKRRAHCGEKKELFSVWILN